jgi:hypothetical protein
MNKTLSTILIVLAVLILAGGIFFAGSMYARMNTYAPGSMMFSRGWNNENSYRPNMMNGRGGPDMMGRNSNNNGYGPGMMRGNGGMMGGIGYNAANLTPLTVEQAKAAAEKYLANLNNSDLQITEIMIFDNNAYIVVKEVSTGNGAFELLADSSSQVAYPEHGPNMMWNLKYGSANHTNMMGGYGGMMGGRNSQNTTPEDVSAEMTVTSEKAIEIAQKYLDTKIAGATAANDPIKFYGYYTLDYEINGKVAGMLSVNGYSGDVFLHTWHGTFIEEAMVK